MTNPTPKNCGNCTNWSDKEIKEVRPHRECKRLRATNVKFTLRSHTCENWKEKK